MKNKNENQESGDFVEINTEFSEIAKTIESKRKESKNKNYFYKFMTFLAVMLFVTVSSGKK